MYKYRIIVTNPGSVSEQYSVQSQYNGGYWNTMHSFTHLADAKKLYQELVRDHSDKYGYRVIESSE